MGVPNVFYSYWFVKSDHLGKVSVGLQSSAGDNAAILVDGSGSLVPANWVIFDNAVFFLRTKNGALSDLTWASLGFCNVGFGAGGDCVGIPENLVRYDSPAFAGFSVSADWGQDTYWDAYARYAGEYNGIKIAAVSGWSETNGCRGNQTDGRVAAPTRLHHAGRTNARHQVTLQLAFRRARPSTHNRHRRRGLLAVRPLHRARGDRSVCLG